MKKFLLLIILLIINTKTLAKEQVSNLIIPVSYFVNHELQLKILDEHLSKYRQASIVGTSGIGKTQLIRMYSYENKNNYDLIWFFDCNLDLNEQFVKLAKQLNMVKQTNISEKIALAKKEVISYLTTINKWLLVFDNLKVNENKQVQNLVEWEHNGHVVFCSQDNEKLPNIIAMPILDRPTIIVLANNLLDNKNNNNIEFLTQSFSGYPILIVQGAQLLNKVKGLDKEEYKKKIYQSTDKIATNISMAIQQLNPNAVKLLNKIALLNNQGFSKQLLTIITDHKDTLDDDIYQLSKFMLISNTNASEDNPIFEMHDIVSNKIMELNGNNNKICLENIISKLPKFKGAFFGSLWNRAQTIPVNLEILLKNAEKYNINIYAMLSLRSELFALYVNIYNISKAKQMFDWFNQKDKNKEFKLWQMSEFQKLYYARYLAVIGVYHNKILNNGEIAIFYFTESLKVLDKLDDEVNYSLKLNILYNISAAYTSLGEIKLAEELIKKIEKLVKPRAMHEDEIYTYIIRGTLFEKQGQYKEALECIDKVIEIFIKNGQHINDPYALIIYAYKTELLNFLGRYQEAYNRIQSLYNFIQNEYKDKGILGYIYIIMAKSALGLGKVDKAYEYINNAIPMLLAEDNNNSENTNYSKNPNLADSYIAQGDILFAQDRLKQAIESYKEAFVIYHYLYGDRSKNIAQ